MLSLLLSVLASFVVVFLLAPKYIRFLEKIGLTGIDIQKKERPVIAEMAGPLVLIGLLLGIFLFIGIQTFLYGGIQDIVKIFAAISTVMIVTFIGVFDDLGGLVKRSADNKEFKRIGLKQWQKPLMTLPAAIPLMAVMVGDTTMALPFLGNINFGIFYTLILIPIAMVGASNAYNMIAGMNGLEAGLGVVLLSSLGIYAYFQGEIAAALLALTLAAGLLALLRFNWYPAKIMPGDSLTYLIGASVATIAIIGNMEKFALLAFLPWIVEGILKLRSRFKAENFGVLQADGTLKAPYPSVYSLTHIAMKIRRFKEWQVVSFLIIIEAVLCAFLLLFYLACT
jgi:UDP-N-acetylglucosamine--dolichyl-phosphate N-acetylglucosaminephosphotransferase